MPVRVDSRADAAAWAAPTAGPDGPALPRTLVVTGHFPPDHGGVQRFTAEFARRLPPDAIAMLAPDAPGSEQVDATLPYPVRRFRGHVTSNPSLARHVARGVREHGAEAVWFTSGVPLAVLTEVAHAAGAARVVVSTHGLEAGLTRWPFARTLLRALRAADVVTTLGAYTAGAIIPHLRPAQLVRRLHGGVDVDRFHPGAATADVRAELDRELGLDGAPYVVSVGRLVPRKGQDALVHGWPRVLRRHPDTRLVLVGRGRDERRLRELARDLGVAHRVVFAGAVPDERLPGLVAGAAAHVLACRDRARGLVLEGLGLSTLEASAAGVPVVVGDSGGARDTVVDGVTGFLARTDVPDRGAAAIAGRLTDLLDAPAAAAELGRAGRDWAARHWTWEAMTAQLVTALAPSHARHR